MKKLLAITSAMLFAATIHAKTLPGPHFKQSPAVGISFTENKGQVLDQFHKPRPDVLYGAMAGNMAVHIKNNGISYQLSRIDTYKEIEDHRTNKKRKVTDQQSIYRIDLNWLNHNANFTRTPDESLPGYSNYYTENCPNGALQVKSYKGIILKNLYNGINLHYYEKNGELKHDYIVAPHADYKRIQLKVEGAEISVNEDGSLLLTTPLGKVQEGAPIVYQNAKQLKARWNIKNNILSFEIENYNPANELIIDPVTRLWGTYYGGTGSEYGLSCSTDNNGNVYMAGYTDSGTGTVIATVGSHQSIAGGGDDGYLVKFDPFGVRQWGTYYGYGFGGGGEQFYACATDASGNVYATGITNTYVSATVIATPGSHQPTASNNVNADAFLVKFNSSGVRQWGTYYGGPGLDAANACVTDANGDVYIAGYTESNSAISTSGSHQPTRTGIYYDAFLVKFNTNGVRQWGTYYGTSKSEVGNSCAIDASGNVYMAGFTDFSSASAIATPGSHQPVFGGGVDAFLVKFNSNGVRQWGTYYGGTGDEFRYSCATDASGNVYLSGDTSTPTSSVIATVGCHQYTLAGNSDAFLVKFNANGVRQWGTYYGGALGESGYCATDASGNVFMAGSTGVTTGTVIATPNAYQPTYGGGGSDAFLVKFDANGTRQWGTYYGGSDNDNALCPAVSDGFGNIYIAGSTLSASVGAIASVGSHQSAFGGGTNADAFLAKFDVCDVAPAQPSAISGPTLVCAGDVTSYNTAPAFGANAYTMTLPGGVSGSGNANNISVIPLSTGIFTLVAGNACGISPQQTLNVTVNPTPVVTVNNGAICAGQSFTIIAGGAVSYTYSGPAVVSPAATTSYTVIGISQSGCTNTAISSVTVNPIPTINVNSGAICAGNSFVIIPGGAGTYTISGGSFTVSPAAQTSYSVTGTSAAGCMAGNTAVSTVTVNAIPTVSVNSGAVCLGSNFIITPGGATTYMVTGGSFTVSPFFPSSYSVTGISAQGCLSSNTAVSNVSVNQLPVISVTTSNSLVCAGESITLTVGGASTYTLNSVSAGANIVISPATTSIYTITGTDANGCRNTAIITQNVDACTGVKENNITGSGIKLYPNPTRGIINLELLSDNEVIILNAIGQIVYDAKLGAGTHQLNFEYWANGMYVVKVKQAGNSKNIKVVKE